MDKHSLINPKEQQCDDNFIVHMYIFKDLLLIT